MRTDCGTADLTTQTILLKVRWIRANVLAEVIAKATSQARKRAQERDGWTLAEWAVERGLCYLEARDRNWERHWRKWEKRWEECLLETGSTEEIAEVLELKETELEIFGFENTTLAEAKRLEKWAALEDIPEGWETRGVSLGEMLGEETDSEDDQAEELTEGFIGPFTKRSPGSRQDF